MNTPRIRLMLRRVVSTQHKNVPWFPNIEMSPRFKFQGKGLSWGGAVGVSNGNHSTLGPLGWQFLAEPTVSWFG
jgi:hypothetical protein